MQMLFVAEDGGSVGTLYYKLGVSDFKCKGWCPASNPTFKLEIPNPIGSKNATRLEDIKPEYLYPFIYPIIPGRFDGTIHRWVNVSRCRYSTLLKGTKQHVTNSPPPGFEPAFVGVRL